ncbi:Phage terminase, small subunit [Planctomycetes bacterium Pan216]|uniref:Phage terminase, small subunit n=1 Tax=Kolteria novifilia TaxID=2527975 RepID=A0A518B5A1_9BACT|nr:Phage terminase, small subunit [Planctomycetes bacterium Pan216]
MGARGPKKTSDATKRLRGTNRKDRDDQSLKLKRGIPTRPKWIVHEVAVIEWDRVVEILANDNVLTLGDQGILALYCQAYADWIEAKEVIEDEGITTETDKGNVIQHPAVGACNKAWERCLKAAKELGLTPASRSRVDREPDAEEDGFAAFIRNK